MDEFLRAKALCPVGHPLGWQLSTESEAGFCRKPEGTTMWLTLVAEKEVSFCQLPTWGHRSPGWMATVLLNFLKINALQEKERKPARNKRRLRDDQCPVSLSETLWIQDKKWGQGSKNNAWRTSKIHLTECPKCLGAQACANMPSQKHIFFIYMDSLNTKVTWRPEVLLKRKRVIS